VYEITEAGTREASDWLSELLAVPAKEYPQFMAGLSFLAALPPDEVLVALQDRQQGLEMRLVRLRGVAQAAAGAGLPRLFGLESEYEEQMMEAELAFVRGLVSDIRSGALEGLEMWRGFFAGDDAVTRLSINLGEPLALAEGVEPTDLH